MYFSYFKRNFENILAILLALVFFIFSSFIISQVQDRNEVKFLSPDETANYFFAKNYAENSEIAVFEVANLYGEEIVRPRSVRSDYGWLKPVSFLGIIILYGKIAAIFGSAVIPYLSPFFASLGIIFFYFLLFLTSKAYVKKNLRILKSTLFRVLCMIISLLFVYDPDQPILL